MPAIFFTIEHEQVLRTDLNNTEIRYTKNCIFLTGGVYTPYSPCMSTPLVDSDQVDLIKPVCRPLSVRPSVYKKLGCPMRIKFGM